MTRTISSPLPSSSLRSEPNILIANSPLTPAYRFLHVVCNRAARSSRARQGFSPLRGPWRESLLPCFWWEHRAPLLLRLEIDEVLGVGKERWIGAVIGPSSLADHLCHFGETCKYAACLPHDSLTFLGTGTRSESTAGPDSALNQDAVETQSPIAPPTIRLIETTSRPPARRLIQSGGGAKSSSPTLERSSITADQQGQDIGLCHSLVFGRKQEHGPKQAESRARTGARPKSAKATVSAMGRKRRPSTCCSVKIGR